MGSNDTPTSGATVRALRIGTGISLRQLAADAGISHSHLLRYEQGERDVSPATRRRLLAILAAAGQRNGAAS